MQVSDLENKYLKVHKDLKRKGQKSKLILYLLISPLFYLYSFTLFHDVWRFPEKYEDGPAGAIFTGTFFILLPIVLVMLPKPLYFINSKRIYAVKSVFKMDVSSVLMQEIPEIYGYDPFKKIHPMIFYSSQLFRRKFDNYIGDDWLKGAYKNTGFVMSELHVFLGFKNLFRGFFVYCLLDRNFENKIIDYSKTDQPQIIVDFQKKHHARIRVSYSKNLLYLTFEMDGYFLENKNQKSIQKLNEDIALLNEIIEIIKFQIDKS